MNLEVYARIKDFENFAVSNHGVVINIKSGKKLKQNNSKGYRRVNLSNGKKKFVHNLVADSYLDKIDNKTLVDHINCDKSNNRVDNLRFCDASENAMNSRISSKNTSGVKGVFYCQKKQKWRAYISINQKKTHIGYFDNLEEAKIARQNKAREIFGEFLNDCEK